jgi:hypothetical protein
LRESRVNPVLTPEEAAAILRAKGAVNGGYGAGGEDSYILYFRGRGTYEFVSESSKRSGKISVARPGPAFLAVSPI